MEASNSSINIATILLVGMIVVGFLSLVTLAIYFFGGESPLERNALGRIEAARNAADVLLEQRRFSRARFTFWVGVIGIVIAALFVASPDDMMNATVSFVDALLVAVGKVRSAMDMLVQQLRSG